MVTTTYLQCCASYSLSDRIVKYTHVYIYKFLGMYLLRLSPNVCFHFRKLTSLWSRDHSLNHFFQYFALFGPKASKFAKSDARAGIPGRCRWRRTFSKFYFSRKKLFSGETVHQTPKFWHLDQFWKFEKFSILADFFFTFFRLFGLPGLENR